MLVFDFYNLKKVNNIFKDKFSFKSNVFLIKTGFLTFCLNFLTIYLMNVSRYTIDDISSNYSKTVFGIIIMPVTFMAMISQYIFQPFLVRITKYIEEKDYISLKKITISLLKNAIVLGLGVLLISILFEKIGLEILYNINLDAYYISMILIILGSVFYALISITSTVLIALRKISIQVIVYIGMSIITTIFANIYILKFDILGASIVYLISMFLVMLAFIVIMFRTINKSITNK